jgi:hypothetical protein
MCCAYIMSVVFRIFDWSLDRYFITLLSQRMIGKLAIKGEEKDGKMRGIEITFRVTIHSDRRRLDKEITW